MNTNTQSTKWSRTHVALNPRLTALILGDIDHHTRISLEETRKFGSDQITRILHQRICAWINDGSRKPVTYRTLLEYVWPADAETAQADLLRRATDKEFARLRPAQVQHARLQLVVKALNKIETRLPGWEVIAASDLPYPPHDEAKSAEENQNIEQEHTAYVTAAARRARADVMDTVVHIRRVWLFRRSIKPTSSSGKTRTRAKAAEVADFEAEA